MIKDTKLWALQYKQWNPFSLSYFGVKRYDFPTTKKVSDSQIVKIELKWNITERMIHLQNRSIDGLALPYHS